MYFAAALSHRWLTLTVLLGVLVCLPALVGEVFGGEKSRVDARRTAEMVDAIVNRNKAPKLVKWPGDFPSKAALFPEDHDWKEEARAFNAITQLEKDQTEAVWEELVKRVGDRRYSETVTSVMTGDAYIEDVGSICGWLAYSRLIGVYWQHLPFNDGRKLSLNVGIGDLAKWRKERAAKALSELQIEVCEKAIQSLAEVNRVSKAEKDKARKKIEAEIAILKKTKRPSHIQGVHSFRYRGRYTPEVAKRVREGVESGKYGELNIFK